MKHVKGQLSDTQFTYIYNSSLWLYVYIHPSKDLDAMECHAEGAKLADSVELSAALSVLRKVPGGEQVGKP